MSGLSLQLRRLLLLLLMAALVCRIGGLHIHLCFDGGLSSVSIHTDGSDVDHADSLRSDTHSDTELALGSDAALKKNLTALDGLVALITLLAIVVLAVNASAIIVGLPVVPVSMAAAFLLRPPLRGPPAQVSL